MSRGGKQTRGGKVAGVLLAVIGFASFGVRQSGQMGDLPGWLPFAEVAAFGAVIGIFTFLITRSRRKQLRGRVKRTVVRCPLCGEDPMVDDSGEPAEKRCIECGRILGATGPS
ncbi:MAG: hypothetical protein ACOYN0_05895 [Phycisphaerales bacterium]